MQLIHRWFFVHKQNNQNHKSLQKTILWNPNTIKIQTLELTPNPGTKQKWGESCFFICWMTNCLIFFIQIKMFCTKEGGAMVNMQDPAACERAVMCLNNSYFFGNQLSVSFSNRDFLKIHHYHHMLDDGTPSAKDYSSDRNNRYFSPDTFSKTRFFPPSKVCDLS